MIDKIHDIIINDRRLKVREISETVNILVGQVWHILHEEAVCKMGAEFAHSGSQVGSCGCV